MKNLIKNSVFNHFWTVLSADVEPSKRVYKAHARAVERKVTTADFFRTSHVPSAIAFR